SQLSSVHFWLPVLLKVPLLLCLLGAVLWVRRPQRGPPDMEPATPCPSCLIEEQGPWGGGVCPTRPHPGSALARDDLSRHELWAEEVTSSPRHGHRTGFMTMTEETARREKRPTVTLQRKAPSPVHPALGQGVLSLQSPVSPAPRGLCGTRAGRPGEVGSREEATALRASLEAGAAGCSAPNADGEGRWGGAGLSLGDAILKGTGLSITPAQCPLHGCHDHLWRLEEGTPAPPQFLCPPPHTHTHTHTRRVCPELASQAEMNQASTPSASPLDTPSQTCRNKLPLAPGLVRRADKRGPSWSAPQKLLRMACPDQHWPALTSPGSEGCWCLHGPHKVMGSVGGSLRVPCCYEEEYAGDVKFWCKGSGWPPWERTLKTSESEREGRSGRVSIRDHPAKLTFTVALEQLTEDDAGTYWCGVEKLITRPPGPGRGVCVPRCVDLCLPGSSALRGPGAVEGWEKGSLTASCRYGPGRETFVKFWCRGAAWGSCKFLVKTSGSEQEVRRGRVSIRDHHKYHTFTVTMEELRLDDADTYWCGIERNGTDLGDKVKVTVDPGKSVHLCGWVSAGPAWSWFLRSVSRDHLSPSRESHPAQSSWSPGRPREGWGRGPGGCSHPGPVPHSSLLGSVHFWLPVLLKVPLLLSLLGAVLWVSRPQRGPPDMEPATPGGHRCVDLCLPGSSALSGPGAVQGWERGSLTVKCRYGPGYETHRKWWCRGASWGSCRILVQTSGSEQEVRRGRVSIRDHQENRTFTVTMEELRLDDADTYWCGIERIGTNLGAQVKVTVDPGESVRLCGACSVLVPAVRVQGSPVPQQGVSLVGTGRGDSSWMLMAPAPPGWRSPSAAHCPPLHGPAPHSVTQWSGDALLPDQQRPLLAPGPPEGSSAPEPALGRPLGQELLQASPSRDMTQRHREAWLPLALLLLHTPGCWCLHGPRMVTGFLGGSLSMQFRYEEEYADDVKFWCRDSWWAPWKGIVKTSNSEREVRSGRVSIRDHPAKLTFTVTLENLTEDDAGTYLCGIKRSLSLDRLLQVEVSPHPTPPCAPALGPEEAQGTTLLLGLSPISPSSSEALLLLTVPGSSALSGPGTVQGWERDSLSVGCRYGPGYETHRKWWCRGAPWNGCRILVQTTGSEQEVRRGRVSIRDHQENRTFTVTMEELRLDDADTYWCGIERNGTDLGDQVKVTVDPELMEPRAGPGRAGGEGLGAAHILGLSPRSSLLCCIHFWLPVLLKVPLLLSLLGAVLWGSVCLPGCWCLQGPRMVTGYLGGSLSVPCSYKEEYADDVKFWCRGPWWTTCSKIVQTSKAEREGRSDRVSIRDHPANRTFTVTLEQLTEADAGTYWCGINTRLSLDPRLQVEVSVSPGDSLLGSVHVWLPVLLKVPLLLSLLGAVLWVSRPERGAGGGSVSLMTGASPSGRTRPWPINHVTSVSAGVSVSTNQLCVRGPDPDGHKPAALWGPQLGGPDAVCGFTAHGPHGCPVLVSVVTAHAQGLCPGEVRGAAESPAEQRLGHRGRCEPDEPKRHAPPLLVATVRKHREWGDDHRHFHLTHPGVLVPDQVSHSQGLLTPLCLSLEEWGGVLGWGPVSVESPTQGRWAQGLSQGGGSLTRAHWASRRGLPRSHEGRKLGPAMARGLQMLRADDRPHTQAGRGEALWRVLLTGGWEKGQRGRDSAEAPSASPERGRVFPLPTGFWHHLCLDPPSPLHLPPSSSSWLWMPHQGSPQTTESESCAQLGRKKGIVEAAQVRVMFKRRCPSDSDIHLGWRPCQPCAQVRAADRRGLPLCHPFRDAGPPPHPCILFTRHFDPEGTRKELRASCLESWKHVRECQVSSWVPPLCPKHRSRKGLSGRSLGGLQPGTRAWCWGKGTSLGREGARCEASCPVSALSPVDRRLVRGPPLEPQPCPLLGHCNGERKQQLFSSCLTVLVRTGGPVGHRRTPCVSVPVKQELETPAPAAHHPTPPGWSEDQSTGRIHLATGFRYRFCRQEPLLVPEASSSWNDQQVAKGSASQRYLPSRVPHSPQTSGLLGCWISHSHLCSLVLSSWGFKSVRPPSRGPQSAWSKAGLASLVQLSSPSSLSSKGLWVDRDGQTSRDGPGGSQGDQPGLRSGSLEGAGARVLGAGRGRVRHSWAPPGQAVGGPCLQAQDRQHGPAALAPHSSLFGVLALWHLVFGCLSCVLSSSRSHTWPQPRELWVREKEEAGGCGVEAKTGALARLTVWVLRAPIIAHPLPHKSWVSSLIFHALSATLPASFGCPWRTGIGVSGFCGSTLKANLSLTMKRRVERVPHAGGDERKKFRERKGLEAGPEAVRMVRKCLDAEMTQEGLKGQRRQSRHNGSQLQQTEGQMGRTGHSTERPETISSGRPGHTPGGCCPVPGPESLLTLTSPALQTSSQPGCSLQGGDVPSALAPTVGTNHQGSGQEASGALGDSDTCPWAGLLYILWKLPPASSFSVITTAPRTRQEHVLGRLMGVTILGPGGPSQAGVAHPQMGSCEASSREAGQASLGGVLVKGNLVLPSTEASCITVAPAQQLLISSMEAQEEAQSSGSQNSVLLKPTQRPSLIPTTTYPQPLHPYQGEGVCGCPPWKRGSALLSYSTPTSGAIYGFRSRSHQVLSLSAPSYLDLPSMSPYSLGCLLKCWNLLEREWDSTFVPRRKTESEILKEQRGAGRAGRASWGLRSSQGPQLCGHLCERLFQGSHVYVCMHECVCVCLCLCVQHLNSAGWGRRGDSLAGRACSVPSPKLGPGVATQERSQPKKTLAKLRTRVHDQNHSGLQGHCVHVRVRALNWGPRGAWADSPRSFIFSPTRGTQPKEAEQGSSGAEKSRSRSLGSGPSSSRDTGQAGAGQRWPRGTWPHGCPQCCCCSGSQVREALDSDSAWEGRHPGVPGARVQYRGSHGLRWRGAARETWGAMAEGYCLPKGGGHLAGMGGQCHLPDSSSTQRACSCSPTASVLCFVTSYDTSTHFGLVSKKTLIWGCASEPHPPVPTAGLLGSPSMALSAGAHSVVREELLRGPPIHAITTPPLPLTSNWGCWKKRASLACSSRPPWSVSHEVSSQCSHQFHFFCVLAPCPGFLPLTSCLAVHTCPQRSGVSWRLRGSPEALLANHQGNPHPILSSRDIVIGADHLGTNGDFFYTKLQMWDVLKRANVFIVALGTEEAQEAMQASTNQEGGEGGSWELSGGAVLGCWWLRSQPRSAQTEWDPASEFELLRAGVGLGGPGCWGRSLFLEVEPLVGEGDGHQERREMENFGNESRSRPGHPLGEGLLCFPGCWCLQGPRIVTGYLGGSLSVPCSYKEEYADDVKFWCRGPWWTTCSKIVQTSKAEREGRSDRVSIRDHPANRTFTVTLEQLTEADAGTYWCGINTRLSLDPRLQVEVSVSPAPRRSTPPATVTVTTTTTTTMQTTTPTSTALTTQRAAQGNSQPNLRPHHPYPPRMLSLLAVVLLLMLGISLLAWRMIPRQVKDPVCPAHQGEPCYENLEMKTQTLLREHGDSRQAEVVYSTVAVPQEDLHYSTVVFDTPNQNSTARGIPSQRPTQPEPEYSVVKRQSEPQYSVVKRT
ncbi:CMRF35-like molecule 8, partial [Galemys pyrenaicus]